jgi:hypothetical protein
MTIIYTHYMILQKYTTLFSSYRSWQICLSSRVFTSVAPLTLRRFANNAMTLCIIQVVTLSAELSLQGFFKLIVQDLMGVTAVTDDINVLAPSTIDEETEDTIGKSVSCNTAIAYKSLCSINNTMHNKLPLMYTFNTLLLHIHLVVCAHKFMS